MFYRDPAAVFGSEIHSDDVVVLTDISPLTNPAWHAPGLVERFDAAMEAILAARPLLVVTGRFAAEALRANYGFPSEKIAIVPSYSKDSEEILAQETYDGLDILAVGHEHVRDNLLSVVEGFKLSGLAQQNTTLRLMVTPTQGAANRHVAEANALLRYAASTTAGVRLEHVGGAPAGVAYAAAAAFIYVPYLDGIGAPLITAMKTGVPIVTSSTGVCPEIAGLYATCIDPENPEMIASALIDSLSVERLEHRQDRSRWIARYYSFEAFESALQAALSPDAAQ
jgi:alpha-1,3-rhamnosyl/mannosyltransferase